MNGKDLQSLLFERIAQRYGNNTKNLSKEVSEVLHLSSNVVYDRLNGKKLLNIEELHNLSSHYAISLDELLQTNIVGFDAPLSEQPKSFDDYLETIHKDLKILATIPDCKIDYVASELPFFHYLFEPSLVYFKMYIWARTIWNLKDYQQIKFNPETITLASSDALITTLLGLYQNFPSTDYWNVNMMDTSINQIRHCLFCDLFEHPNEALHLLRGLERIVDNMEETIIKGRKNENSKTMVYHNELIENSTLIVVNSSMERAIYMVYDSPNFFIGRNPRLFSLTEDYMEKIQQHSFRLSEERHRVRFFKVLRNKLYAAKEEFKTVGVGQEMAMA